jgi:hypothetical protein
LAEETRGKSLPILDEGTEKMLHRKLRMTSVISENLGFLESFL